MGGKIEVQDSAGKENGIQKERKRGRKAGKDGRMQGEKDTRTGEGRKAGKSSQKPIQKAKRGVGKGRRIKKQRGTAKEERVSKDEVNDGGKLTEVSEGERKIVGARS